MKALKRILGIVWILLAPTSLVLMVIQMIEKVSLAESGIERLNTSLQWGIILFIFIPVAIGLLIFGMYSVKGEYDDVDSFQDND
jgi:hypothetical protein